MSYVVREVDTILEKDIEDLEGTLFFLMGEGGVGKSTLLKKFFDYDRRVLPLIYIDIKDDFQYSKTFSNILLDRDTTFIKNCKHVDKVRKIIDDNPQFFSSILNTYSEEVTTVSSKFGDDIGLNLKTLFDSFKLLSKFTKRSYEKKKSEIEDNIELALLMALQKDFKDGGLFMFDTYEKVKDIRIMSKVDFIDNKISKKSLGEKGYPFSEYLKKLRKSLGETITFLIASRSEDSLFQDLSKTRYINIPEFSKPEIKIFFKNYKVDIGLPTDKQLTMIAKLTNGNPLILSYFPNIIKEYKSWNEIDYREMTERVTSDSLLSYLFDCLLKNRIDNEIQENIWKLVIPRVLTEEILSFLFPNEKDRTILLDERILTKGIAYNSDKYYLHDNVYQAIRKSLLIKTKDNFYNFHDLDQIRQLHFDLIKYYQTLVYFKNVDFDACYHKIMTMREFEKRFDITREEFAEFLLGSFSWKYIRKISSCNELQSYSDYKIEMLIENFEQERDIILPEIGEELYSEFVNYTLSTKNQQGIYDLVYLKKLLKNKLYSNQWVIHYVIGNTYYLQNKKEQAFEAYNLALEKVSKKDIVFFKMGLLFYKSAEYTDSLKAYKKAIEVDDRNHKYYTNLGVLYNALGDYKLSKQMFLHAKSLKPNHKIILLNLAFVYTKLENFDEAIELYNILIQQYPLDYQFYYELGKVYYLINNYELAKTFFKKALTIDESSEEARKCLAGCNVELGEYNEATNIYTSDIKRNNDIDSHSGFFEDCMYDCLD